MLREQRLPSNNSGRAPGGLDDGSGAEEADAGAGEMSVPPRIFSLVVALIPVEAPGVHAWRTHDALRTHETLCLVDVEPRWQGSNRDLGKVMDRWIAYKSHQTARPSSRAMFPYTQLMHSLKCQPLLVRPYPNMRSGVSRWDGLLW